MLDRKTWELVKSKIPLPCVDVAIITDKGVLLTRRAIDPAQGYWFLPGGMVQLGEMVEEAGVKQVLEEVGVLIGTNDLECVGVVNYFHPGRQDLTVVFRARIPEPMVKLDWESTSYTWATLDNLPTPMEEVTKKEIELAFKGVK